VTLFGEGHWAVCRSANILESELWVWWIEIEGVTDKMSSDELGQYLIDRSRATEFMRKLKPLLPEDIESRIERPACTPGGRADLQIQLTELSDPEATVVILNEFFPELCQLAT